MSRRRAVVVTGGGAGIGAAVAASIGRAGAHVVTVDPLVSLDGAERLPTPEVTSADRIVAAGGSARASNVSVTDREAVQQLFDDVASEFGGLDAVVNVAGITRPTGFARGSEAEWAEVLRVHLDGYLNVLGAALPHMAKAGSGHIVGVTSGSGWRAADAGAYSCAKRAVAALTWQLGRVVPDGIAVNAISPIAMTRMVTAAMERAQGAGGGATGGLSFGSMPSPDELGPFGAYLVNEELTWCRGRVLFAGGPEVAVVEEPRLLEAVGTEGAASLARVFDTVVPGAWVSAEAHQASTGGSNPRFPALFDDIGEAPRTPTSDRCLVVADDPTVARTLTAALEARGVACRAGSSPAEVAAEVDAVVVASMGAGRDTDATAGWERTLAEHRGLVEAIGVDARWARAAADAARPLRLVTITDATTAGGRSRAQASAQLSRAAPGATEDRVQAFSMAVESTADADQRAAAELAAHLVSAPEAAGLAGAELVVGAGWAGLRSHPRPGGTITFGGPELPAWFDGALRAVVGGR